MCRKHYRCGSCGQSIDEYGNPLDIELCKQISEDEFNNAELGYGYCCFQEQSERQYVTVTRDMAIDAGDMSLEGQKMPW